MKITKQRLKEIIKEELQSEARLPAEERPGYADEPDTFAMSADELIGLGKSSLRQLDKDILGFQSAIARLVEQHDAGEFVYLATHATMLQAKLDDLKMRFDQTLGRFGERR